jgi:AAA domain
VVSQALRVLPVAQVQEPPAGESHWLVESLWSAGAVGIIGGAPKSCKTWLALELAVAVASGRPCLGRFPVPAAGPALIFAAEDAPHHIKRRLQSLARARQLDFNSLDVRLIVEDALRLDRAEDLRRLHLTLAKHRPKLLVLDPYVRLQRADENDARQVSTILSALRELSRAFQAAVALVHHARKNGAEIPGQALRGSGDFWAWGDSNLYVARRRDGLLLTIEHRSAPSPAPLSLRLLSAGPADDETDSSVRLEVQETPSPAVATISPKPSGSHGGKPALSQRILSYLAHSGHSPHRALRAALHVRDTRLSEALRGLESSGHVAKTPHGWKLLSTP